METLEKYIVENRGESHSDKITDKTNVIKTINFNQQDLINDVIKLHIPSGQIDCDPCFSKGVFYKNGKVKIPPFRYDIEPQLDSVEKCDCRKLPLKDNSINSLMYDPPFVVSVGPSLTNSKPGSNLTHKRFSSSFSIPELWKLYEDSIKEFYRILDDKGILIVKCMDTVSGGINYFSHTYIMNKAYEIGFYPKDLFILLAKSRMSSPNHKNQKHGRKFHSYFLVFQKTKCKVNYNL